jgi:hypothetical protein
VHVRDGVVRHPDVGSGGITCANAGRNPRRALADGRVEFLDFASAPALGSTRRRVPGRLTTLEPGDVLVMYTDG